MGLPDGWRRGEKQLGHGAWSGGAGGSGGEGIDVTFLSTAKAGTVLVKAAELEGAVEALECGMREVNEEGP